MACNWRMISVLAPWPLELQLSTHHQIAGGPHYLRQRIGKDYANATRQQTDDHNADGCQPQ